MSISRFNNQLHLTDKIENASAPPENNPSSGPLVTQSSISSVSIETGDKVAVEAVMRAIGEAFSTCPWSGPQSIFRFDADFNPLRYEIPNLSSLDYTRSIKKISGLYQGRGTGLGYEAAEFEGKPIGCYEYVSLHKSLEQSEDDYETILKAPKYKNYERHALHTDCPRNLGVAFSRRWNFQQYTEEGNIRREKQISGMQEAVARWKETGYFANVFVPDDRFRIEELKHYPEFVACTDMIMFSFKQLETLKVRGNFPEVLDMPPSADVLQPKARASWDAKQGMMTKMGNNISSLLSTCSSLFQTVEETSNDGLEPLQEVQNNENNESNPHFFPESGDVLATASRSFSDVCEAASYNSLVE